MYAYLLLSLSPLSTLVCDPGEEGRKAGRQEGRKAGRKEQRKKGGKDDEGRKGVRMISEGRKEGRESG
jgi:hypothetical protein